MIYGIDISTHQSSIPEFNGDFIIIRAGYSISTDVRFKTHYNNAIQKGKRVGVYWYSYALTVEEAINEAKMCLKAIQGLDIKMGVWFDMEDADGYKGKNGFKFTKTNISNICNAFCNVIESAGYYAGIYANLNYMRNYINCPKYDKWIACWGLNDGKIPSKFETEVRKLGGSIWQYTSKLNGQNLDGDVLTHNDIDMYNVQPEKKSLNLDSLEADIIEAVKEVIKKYRS